MAYSDVKSQFQSILNRRDITPTLVNTFMGFGLQRINQELRLPKMETVAELTTDGTAELTVPSDLLEVISVHTNDDTNGRTKLTKTDLQTILTYASYQDMPRYYHREGTTIYIGPMPPDDQTVFVHYFKRDANLSADSDTNWITDNYPLLWVYAALAYAADYFIDDRIKLFEDRYVQIRDNLQAMFQQDEVVNASIRPTFSFE